MVEDCWGEAVDPDKLEDVLQSHSDIDVVAFVYAEISTGVASDVATLCEIAHRHDCLTIVDTVTSLGGSPLKVDEWGIDAVYSGSQKCLSCTFGLFPVSFNQRAIDKLQSRKQKVQSWFLDLNLVMGYWGTGEKRAYHHTAPINALYGLHEALLILKEEGLENAWARHQKNHEILRAGIEAMGLEFIVTPEHRLPQLNAVSIPAGVDEAAVRRRLLQDYNLEIGAGLGALAGKVWRIGQMGYASNLKNIIYCLAAIDEVLTSMRAPINSGVAVKAALHAEE
jgi:alanine-glyoxylate transaminase/serine-glyoxylate transaminase/serine-pyruvate transaminase